MLLDKYLKDFHFNEIHSTTISASCEHIYPIVDQVDLTDSQTIELLFTIRGLPKQARSIQEFINSGFIFLDEKPDEELVLGLVSQPWKYNVSFQSMSPDEFRSFSEKDYVKVAWNFHLSPIGKNRTHISTETRIFCTDKKAKLKFSFYWFLISLFSGLIRIIMLNLIKREAEQATPLFASPSNYIKERS